MKRKIFLKKVKFNGDAQMLQSDMEYLKTKEVKRIEFFVGKDKFVITPDFDSFRIHKSADDSFGDNTRICINPDVGNEILIS